MTGNQKNRGLDDATIIFLLYPISAALLFVLLVIVHIVKHDINIWPKRLSTQIAEQATEKQTFKRLAEDLKTIHEVIHK